MSEKVPGYKVPFKKFVIVTTCHVPPLGRRSENVSEGNGTFAELCRWASRYVLDSFPSAGLDSVRIYGVPDFSSVETEDASYAVGGTGIPLSRAKASDVFVEVPESFQENVAFTESTSFLLASVDRLNADKGEKAWTAVPRGSLIKN